MNPEPGALPIKTQVERMIRVNHAGEYGAKRIYEGQLAVLKGKPSEPTIRHMADQEAQHLKTFEELLTRNRVRPTLLQPLWHVAGFALGAATALMGEKAAMACTVAVEEVIDEHYQKQEAALDDATHRELKGHISQFRAEELEHRDIGLAHHAEDALGYPLLSAVVKRASKLAIWLSTRI